MPGWSTSGFRHPGIACNKRKARGGGGGVLICFFSRWTIDHAFLSRQSTGPARTRDTSNWGGAMPYFRAGSRSSWCCLGLSSFCCFDHFSQCPSAVLLCYALALCCCAALCSAVLRVALLAVLPLALLVLLCCAVVNSLCYVVVRDGMGWNGGCWRRELVRSDREKTSLPVLAEPDLKQNY